MKRGDIVLVPFPFTNLQGIKRRPALVLYKGQKDAVVAFITSKLKTEGEFDVYVARDPENGLKQASLVKPGKLATLDFGLILGKIGSLEEEKLQEVIRKLTLMFQL